MMVPALAMEASSRSVGVPELFGVAATEGTVLPTMTDTDGSASDAARDEQDSGPAPPESQPDSKHEETDAELTARFERDAIPLLDQLYGGAL